jgi:hypothetical protein
MQISEAELRSLTSGMVEAHHDTYPKMGSAVAEWTEAERDNIGRSFSRRGFLATVTTMIAGGVALSALPAAASAKAAVTTVTPRSTAGVPTDVVVAGLAASLENLAVATYGAALSAAGAGKLGMVPPAVATFAKTAMGQHKDHAAAWNSIIQSVGYKAITAPNPVIAKIVDADFAKVTNVTGVAELALTLEGAAAATYLEAISALSTPSAIAIAASIQPVEMQHMAILNFVLGKYPVPDAFASLLGAAPVSDAAGLSFVKS